MRFIQQYGYSVRQGKLREYQAYLSENQDRIRKACPEGVEYLGTYATVFTTEKQAGEVFDLWALDSYAAMDAMAESLKSGDLAHIAEEAGAFWEPDRSAPWSNVVLKDMTIATVFDLPE